MSPSSQSGNAVYVTAYDLSSYNPGRITTSTASPGWLFGFATGSAVHCRDTRKPLQRRGQTSALVADPTNRFIYVTDFASNQLIGYGIYTGYSLSFLLNGPYKTWRRTYLNRHRSSRQVHVCIQFTRLECNCIRYRSAERHAVDQAMNSTGSATNNTDTQPVSMAVDPALGRYVYTANFLGNSVSGFRLDPTGGTLKQTQTTPYPTGLHPTALVWCRMATTPPKP